MNGIRHLLAEIFNSDFTKCKNAKDFARQFFKRDLTIADLHKVFELVNATHYTLGKITIPSCLHLKTKSKEAPFAILAQLHGNEPAGLAGIVLAMALHEAGLLNRDVLCIIGNPLAARQYFSAYQEAPRARQEIRDAYRCGLGEGGVLLPDMNRIPVDFMTRKPDTPHLQRAQELFIIGQHISGILDIHSARGNMVCITDHKHNAELANSPIRTVLMGLAEAISANSSSANTQVQTLKTLLAPLPNIKHQVGIEAGKHEANDTPHNAALFSYIYLHTVGVSSAEMKHKKNAIFDCYHVQPKWNYNDLAHKNTIQPDDKIYMCIPCLSIEGIPQNSDRVVARKKDGSYVLQTIMQYMVQPAGELQFALYQYDELEELHENAVVAIALPSGTTFKVPATASGIFFSKSASLYSKDPSVGPWPVAAANLTTTKFCYPCVVKKQKL